MLANFLSKADGRRVRTPFSAYFKALKWPLWVVVGFLVAAKLMQKAFDVLSSLHVSLEGLDSSVFNTILAILIYALSLVLIIGLPRLLKKDQTSLKELALQRLMSWSDIGMAPVGFVVYFILTITFIYTATTFIPDFNAEQAQEIGFSNLTRPFELILAFITLVILAPVAEEVLFRGYLFGKLRRTLPFFMATLLTSVLFGLLHVSNGTWNVAVDVFALSLVLCYVRESTSSIWTGILIHMMKNGIAYYFLFIKPLLFHTIGG